MTQIGTTPAVVPNIDAVTLADRAKRWLRLRSSHGGQRMRLMKALFELRGARDCCLLGIALAVGCAEPKASDPSEELDSGAGATSSGGRAATQADAGEDCFSSIECTENFNGECWAWSNGVACTENFNGECWAWNDGMTCTERLNGQCWAWSNGVTCTDDLNGECSAWSNGATCAEDLNGVCWKWSGEGLFGAGCSGP